MASQKIVTSLSDYLLYSVIFNIVCVVFIIVMIVKFKKYGKENQRENQQVDLRVSAQYKTMEELNSQTKKQDEKEQVIQREDKSTQKKEQKERSQTKTGISKGQHKNYQEIQIQRADIFQLQNLRQQLQLQQERSRHLQNELNKFEQNHNKLKKQLEDVKKALKNLKDANPQRQIPMTQSKQIEKQQNYERIPIRIKSQIIRTDSIPLEINDVVDLKNQLEYCQKLLHQSYENQKELKNQISMYQKLGEVTFNHPQFHRLREKNKLYKQTILKLQQGLLEGHTERRFDSFSFRTS